MWNFFRKAASNAPSVERELIPDTARVYAIGDIHGCRQQLDRLIDKICDDIAGSPVSEAKIVFLGDYIDRGPDSPGVLARLAARTLPCEAIFLRGNHEEMLISFLSDAGYLSSWRHFGGLETLHAFGIDVQSLKTADDFERAREHLLTGLSRDMLNLLDATKTSHECGNVFFCHAGVRPGVPLSRQAPEDLLWIREEFLSSSADHGKLVVHGHTPVEAPDVRPNRINVDTGAYLTGTLTALVIQGATFRFLST